MLTLGLNFQYPLNKPKFRHIPATEMVKITEENKGRIVMEKKDSIAEGICYAANRGLNKIDITIDHKEVVDYFIGLGYAVVYDVNTGLHTIGW